MPADCPARIQQMGSGMTVYYIVPNLDEVFLVTLRQLVHSYAFQIEAKVHKLGGRTCLKKTSEGENSAYMNFNDPQGNRFGAYNFGG